MRTIRFSLLSVIVLPALVIAQGRGHPNHLGEEPWLSIDRFQAGAAATLRIGELLPAPAIGMTLFISDTAAATSLAAFGLPDAVLGFDPFAPPPSLLTFGPVVAGATGVVDLPLLIPPSLDGQWLHVQGLQPDGLATGGIAITDSLSVPFGPTSAAERVLVLSSNGRYRERVVFSDATRVMLPAFADPELDILPVGLTARQDPASPTTGAGWVEPLDATRDSIAFPGGGRLLRVREASGHEAWRLLLPGRPVSIHDFPRVLPRPGRDGWSPFVATSPFVRLAAVLSEEPVLSAGGASLFLFSPDGSNLPGTQDPVLPIVLPASLSTFEIDEDSLTFLDGALLIADSDAGRVARITLQSPYPATEVPLPRVGGLAPSECDSAFAWSRNGALAILSAGRSESFRDLIGIGPSGAAVNVTQWPGEYEDVSHGDLLDGDSIAVSPDGSRIAFIREYQGSQELFAKEVGSTAPPIHISPDPVFEDTIETLVGLYFLSASQLAFRAGQFGNQVDLYRWPWSTNGGTTQNVTATSGITTPPFDVGATLVPIETTASSTGRLVQRLRASGATTETIALLGPTGAYATLPGIGSGTLDRIGFAGRDHLILTDATTSRIVDASGALTILATAQPGQLYERFLAHGDRLWIAGTQAGAATLTALDAAGTVTEVTGIAAQSLSTATIQADGSTLLTGTQLNGLPGSWTIAPNASTATITPWSARAVMR